MIGFSKKSDTNSNDNSNQTSASGSNLPRITKEQRDYQVEILNQQRYAIEVEGAKQDLRGAAAVTATKAVKANTAEVKGYIAQERFTQATHQLQAAKIDTQRTSLLPQNAQVRLGMAQSASNVLQVRATVQQAKDKLKERNFNLLVGGKDG